MQSYTFDYYQYKKKINKKSKLSFVVLLILIICLAMTVLFIYPKNLGSHEFYFIEIDAFQTYKEASVLSAEIQTKGGSGYIYFDGKYRVFASFYNKEKDAKTVTENLKAEYKNSSVFIISTPKNINTTNLSYNQKSKLKLIQNTTLDIIEKLNDLSIKTDKNEIKTENIELELKKTYTSYNEVYSEYISLFKSNSKLNMSKSYANEIKNSLEFLSSKNINNYSQELKYELTKIIINYCSFVESF